MCLNSKRRCLVRNIKISNVEQNLTVCLNSKRRCLVRNIKISNVEQKLTVCLNSKRRCLVRNIKISNVSFKESLLTTKEVEARHDDRPVTMGAGERSGSRQWPLCLWGFSWPGASPGTWEPESSSQSHYTDITRCPEQSAVMGAGE